MPMKHGKMKRGKECRFIEASNHNTRTLNSRVDNVSLSFKERA
jgi:hypothetical protein